MDKNQTNYTADGTNSFKSDINEYVYTSLKPRRDKSLRKLTPETSEALDQKIHTIDVEMGKAVLKSQRSIQGKKNFSDLTEEEAENLMDTFAVKADTLSALQAEGLLLEASLPYAQLENAYGFTVEELLAKCPSSEDCTALFKGMNIYGQFLHEDWKGTEADQMFRRCLLDGFSMEQVKSAYVVSQTLGIPMGDLLAKGETQTVYPEGMTAISKENYRLFAHDLGIYEQALVDYARDKNKTFKRIESMIGKGQLFEVQLRDPEESQRAYEAYEERLATEQQARQAQRETGQAEAFEATMEKLAEMGYSAVERLGMETDHAQTLAAKRQINEQLASHKSSQAATLSQSQAPMPGAPTMPLLTAAVLPGDFYLADPYVNDSYDYHNRDRYNVNMSTGSFSQNFVDVVIPGRNGLDLVIGHQYFSDQSYLDREIGLVDFDYGNTKYRLSSGFTAFTNPGGARLPSYYDMNYPSRIFDTYALAVDHAYYSTEPDGYRLVSGVTVWYEFWQAIDMTGTEPYLSATFWTDTIPNTHFIDLYGLGIGWKFMFSSIEEYGAGGIYQYLHLTDGTVHMIDWSNPTSYLKDYWLTDMKITQPGALNVPGIGIACWVLAHKDGKKEYFDLLGRLIGIVDRYENTIKLVHTKDVNGLPRIVITDTWGNVVTIYGELTNEGHKMMVTLPQGSLQYDVARNVTSGASNYWHLSGSHDQMGNPTSHGYMGLFQTCVDIFNSSNSAHNRYSQLTDTNYPNGVSDIFDYSQTTHYFNETLLGYHQVYRLDKAVSGIPAANSQGAMAHETRYAYSGNGHCRPVALPTGYTYTTTATEVRTRPVGGVPVSSISSSTMYTFEWKGLLTKAETRTSVGVLAKTQLVEYDSYRLPAKETNRFYENNGSAYRDEISMVEHDSKRNVVATWSPLAEGDRNNTEYKTTYTYDTGYFNLPTSKTFKQGANTTIQEIYSVDGTRIKIEYEEKLVNYALMAKTDFGYDAYGNVTSVKQYRDDFTGFALTEYSYPNGALLTEVKATGIKNADGSLAAGTPGYAAGVVVTKTGYNSMGLPISQTDANNLTTSLQRNLRGDVTVVTNPDASTKQYNRNYQQNTLLFTDERGSQLLYKYMAGAVGGYAGHNGESVVDVQSGDTLSYKRYDELDRLEEEGGPNSKTNYAYDDVSRLTTKTTTDSRNVVVAQESYAYDEIYSNATQRRVQKTILGELGAPSIVTAEYTDKNGRVVQAGRYLGGMELLDAYTYDYVGNLLTEQSAFAADRGLAYSAKWEYDYAGRVTKTYNADGGYATNVYNALGLLSPATDYAGTPTTYAYDDLGCVLEEKRVVEQTGGNTYYTMKRYAYDPAGSVKKEEWTNNPVGSAYTWGRTDYDYDNRGRLEYATMYDGAAVDNVTKYSYDLTGNVLFMQVGMSSKNAADGKTTAYTYDRFGNQHTMTDPLSQTESRNYNTSSLMTDKTDRNGNLFVYAYDGLKRLKTVTVTQNNTVVDTISYGYYLTGAKKREESAARGWLAYDYDSLGRLATVTESGGATKQYGYNKADGRETFLAQAGNATILDMSYTYDNQSRLSTVKQSGTVVGTYGYDANGNRDSLAYANGVTTGYAYNKANWLTGMTNQNSVGVLSSYAYSYYADGNQRTKANQDGRLTTYLYDGLGRLGSESESTGLGLAYTYDRSGNRATLTATGPESYSTVYHYDDNNRLTDEEKTEGDTYDVTSYNYDANGNQTQWIKDRLTPAGQGAGRVSFGFDYAAQYEYDAFNQMTMSFVNGKTARYSYRVDGLRQSKEETDTGGINYVWDGSNLVAEMKGDKILASYVRGINILHEDTSTGQRYFLYNGHGDVTGLTSASGAMVWRYDYDAFGNEREILGQGAKMDANPFRYSGEYRDLSSGLYYLRARNYNPATGRFLIEDTHWNPGNMIYGDYARKINERQDPTGLNLYTYVPDIAAIGQSGNLYAYCGNNPIMFVDSNGEIFMLVAGGIGAGLGAIIGGGGKIISNVVQGNKWNEGAGKAALIGAGVGGAIGLTGGAAVAFFAAGTATASTAMVVAGVQLKIAGIGIVGYSTFNLFKQAYGNAGSGMAWHHVIPQTADNIQRFGAEMIHNAANIVKIQHGANTLHQMITNHYNTLHSSGMRVYQWLQIQSFETQLAYGLQKLTEYSKQLGIAIEYVK